MVAVLAGDDQGGRVLRPLLVHDGALLQEDPADLLVTTFGSLHKRSLSCLANSVHSRPHLEQF